MKFVHACTGVAILGVAGCLCLAILDGRALIKAQNGVAQREGMRTRELADRHARQIEQDLRLREDAALAEVKALHASADAQLTATRSEASAQLTAALGEVAAWRAEVGGKAERVVAVAEKAGPVLDRAAALGKDAQDSWDDLYPDVKATVESGTVLTTSVAQASEAVRDAAPKIAAAATGTAEDVKREADELTAPKTTLQKAGDWAKLIVRLVAGWL